MTTTDTSARYCEVRSRTEALAHPLGPEDQVVQSMPDCSPTKWHRAHTTWFFEEFVLGPFLASHQPVDPRYRYLFNSYYEAVGPRHPRSRRGLLTRPTVAEVGDYRLQVDRAVLDLLGTDHRPELAEVVVLGTHHEEQHQELLLMDAKHLLFQNPLRPAYREAPEPPAGDGVGPARAAAGPAGWVARDGGLVEVGHDGAGFAFDNEGPRHLVHLQPFAVADRLVTCGEWLAFMEDGGYQRPELWLSDGWAAVQEQGWDAPLYWERADDGGWTVFTLHGPVPLDPAEPVVHVSYYEADAYAHWTGGRLPTEAEWEVATAGGAPGADLTDGRLQPSPARPGEAGRARQVLGDVWEWTASPYTPFPGFRANPGAVGEYNGKFMVNQHVLRGGSCVTPPGHARPTYRNFFPPGARWAFSGLRVARDG